jgi:peptidoglycan hydrolase CwlO-like protein
MRLKIIKTTIAKNEKWRTIMTEKVSEELYEVIRNLQNEVFDLNEEIRDLANENKELRDEMKRFEEVVTSAKYELERI